jgi:quercetin dioxygenase-like cupin family protein
LADTRRLIVQTALSCVVCDVAPNDSEPDVITNPVSGQTVTFVSTTPEKLETRFEIESGRATDPHHIHPLQSELISVVEGRIRRSLADGSEDVLEPGQNWEIPPGTPHTWTAIDGYVKLRIDFRPALRTRLLMTRLFRLAEEGKLNSRGFPSPLQVTVIALEYERELRLASPPWFVQRVLLGLLAPLARLLGYRA